VSNFDDVSVGESFTGVQLRRRLGAGSVGGSEVYVDSGVAAVESFTGVQLRRRLGAGSVGGSEVYVDNGVAAVSTRSAFYGSGVKPSVLLSKVGRFLGRLTHKELRDVRISLSVSMQ
jgi:hypothetical protein